MLSLRQLAVVSSVAISSVALAQDAVQWRVEDGGNGHWYRLQNDGGTWEQARLSAESQGGHLATITSSGENSFIWHFLNNSTFYPCFAMLGGYQDLTASDFVEPAGGWRWVTGEEFVFTAWHSIEPNNSGAEHYLAFREFNCSGSWNDIPDDYSSSDTYVVEWSADCNGDGIVDYGQIRTGALADQDANGVPDTCEDTITVPTDHPTIQAAVDAAPTAFPVEVVVLPGTYAESVNLRGKAISLRASGEGEAVILAPSGLRGIVATSGEPATSAVIGITFRATGSLGGGAVLANSSTRFVTCRFESCTNPEGGAVRTGGGSPSFTGCTFSNCVATGPAGTYGSAGGIHLVGGTALIESCSFLNRDGGCAADAILNEGGSCVVRSSLVRSGSSATCFGQIYNTGSLLVEDTVFEQGNKAAVFAWAPYTVRRCVFRDMTGYSVLDRRFGNYVVDQCEFQNCRVSGPLFMSYYSGSYSIGNSNFCNCAWNGEMVTGAWTDAGGNTFACPCQKVCVVPTDFAAIQDAIDAAPVGQHRIIEVLGGIYNQSFALNGKNVVIRGAADGSTILDGGGLTGSIAKLSGEPASAGLENLVFRNGTTGSRFTPDATFTVGGAIYANSTAAYIRNCRFESCRADFGGAIYQYAGSIAWDNCVFTGNIANSDGGGAQTYNCTGMLRNCTFTGNRCGMNGPGSGSGYKAIGSNGEGETVTIDSCAFSGNIAGDSGSAIEFYEHVKFHPGVLQILNTSITGNISGEPIPSGTGGVRVLGRQSSCLIGAGTVICGNTQRNVSGPYLASGSPTICDCLADLSGDGVVNAGDLGLLLSSWGIAGSAGNGDVNRDGVVNAQDLGELLANWGICD